VTGRVIYQLDVGELYVKNVLFSPDGSRFAVLFDRFAGGTYAEGIVRVYDTETGTQRCSAGIDQQDMQEMAFAPDGRTLAVTGFEMIMVLNSDTGGVAWNQAFGGRIGIKPSFSPDGHWILSGSTSEAVMFNTATGARRWQDNHSGGDDELRGLAFSPDGHWTAQTSGAPYNTPTDGGKIRVLDAQTGQLRWTLHRDEPVFSAAYSPDGQSLLTGSDLSVATLIDPETGAVRGLLSHAGAAQQVNVVGFSPNSELALTIQDCDISIYDVARLELRHLFS
jgi:WD40 repeat protein